MRTCSYRCTPEAHSAECLAGQEVASARHVAESIRAAIDAAEAPPDLDFEGSFSATGEFLTFAPESTPIEDIRRAIAAIRARPGFTEPNTLRVVWCPKCGGAGHVARHCRIRR